MRSYLKNRSRRKPQYPNAGILALQGGEDVKALVEDGALKKKAVGARAVVYWRREEAGDDAPAEPLREFTGMVDADEAAQARERSESWREEFEEDIGVNEV